MKPFLAPDDVTTETLSRTGAPVSRRQACQCISLSCASVLVSQPTGRGDDSLARSESTAAKPTRTKKGICGKGTKCDLVNAGWYYNWNWAPTPGKIDAEFVPMIKGKFNAVDKAFAKIEKLKESHGVTHLLGFNEPDSPKQGNTSVEKAVALWPKLMDTGLRLGSPAVTDNARGKAWFKAFAAQAAAKKLRVDFIAVHRYPNLQKKGVALQFLRSLEQLYREYRLPIWITEFSGLNFGSKDRHMTPADNVEFMQNVLPKLEQLPYIERYAWFSGDIASLYVKDKPSELGWIGKVYRQF
ncbi:glycosyl hydrolase [Novipirellula maiorica]|nr:glycosyl hydrolase [Rhodopirellula maiorica]